MNILGIFSRKRREPPCDAELVARARDALGLLDFEFFRAAWRYCHAGEPEDHRLEPAFVTYLQQQRVPAYVRHFARNVLTAAERGELDPAAFGLPRRAQAAAVVGALAILPLGPPG